uniref:Zinc finger protein n=1 Tax=Gongylonema pulchrum TaxID=637853 RepID=A0A183DSF1_9BILA
LQSEPAAERDAAILGAPNYSAIEDLPICKSNSRICKFIACSAHNFKNDESISNLNLAAQILADTKLRKAITSDPSTLLSVCHDQGLSVTQCKLFANAFQLLDRFISTIEPVSRVAKKLHRYIIKDDPYYDDSDAPPIPIRPGSYQQQHTGSQTWSIHANGSSDAERETLTLREMGKANASPPVHSEPVIPEDANNLSNLSAPNTTILKLMTVSPPNLFTLPPLMLTFPTFAPLMFAVTPVAEAAAATATTTTLNLMPKEIQNFLFPHLENKILLPNMNPIPAPAIVVGGRQQDSSDIQKSARRRRSSDYYDNIENEDEEGTNTGISDRRSAAPEDDQPTTNAKKPNTGRRGLLDCIRFLEE